VLPPPPPTARLELKVLAHACVTGPNGRVTWALDGQTLTQQLPGGLETQKVVAKTHRIEAKMGRKVLLQRRVTLSKDSTLALTVGCDAGPKQDTRLLPLSVLYAPEKGCSASLSVRMAGKSLTLQPFEGYTVYVPSGRHEVVVGPERVAKMLKTVGSVLRRASCIESGDSKTTGKTP